MHTRKLWRNMAWLLVKFLLGILIVAGVWQLGEYAYTFGHSLYDNQAVSDPPGKDVAIVIPENCPVKKAAKLLEAKGLIRDDLVFRAQERLSKYHGQIQAGNYVLNTSQNAEQMLAILSGHPQDAGDGAK